MKEFIWTALYYLIFIINIGCIISIVRHTRVSNLSANADQEKLLEVWQNIGIDNMESWKECLKQFDAMRNFYIGLFVICTAIILAKIKITESIF